MTNNNTISNTSRVTAEIDVDIDVELSESENGLRQACASVRHTTTGALLDTTTATGDTAYEALENAINQLCIRSIYIINKDCLLDEMYDSAYLLDNPDD